MRGLSYDYVDAHSHEAPCQWIDIVGLASHTSMILWRSIMLTTFGTTPRSTDGEPVVLRRLLWIAPLTATIAIAATSLVSAIAMARFGTTAGFVPLLLVRTLAAVLSAGLLTALARNRSAHAHSVAGEVAAASLPDQSAFGQSNVEPQPYRILIVTDDTMLAQWLRTSLLAAGFAVSVAGDGRQAINVVRQQAVDLLLVERQLPDGDGLDLCRLLRFQAWVPIVIIAA